MLGALSSELWARQDLMWVYIRVLSFGKRETMYSFFQFLAGAKRQALQVTSSQVAAEGGIQIDHNSLNFWARSLKFCIEVRMDSPNKVQKSTKEST